MSDNLTKSLEDIQNDNGITMKANIIDQINTNQQSNMTLSAYSVITQVCSTVKINNVDIEGENIEQ
ncbi:hypothetical protein CLPU_10c01180 [Gottschalkia purinilytica]|uniref:Uncharacterized protein n=1 Tax=Gottschalkia purinilytica TaxID=1503 RepID=A0A0L0W936_GOTPU|nr:hypothetical protein [Gottschalkia purinilytica]KNF08063.1 hypothetical protein CLPU_10c01180 [Gottschalkia purinilytica]